MCGRRKTRIPSSGQLDLELTVAKMMFRWLNRAGKLPRNPLELARRANEPNERETWLEEPQVQQLIAGADILAETEKGWGPERRPLLFRAFVAAKFGAGMRFEETRPLRRDRIGTDGIVELSAKKTKGKKRRTVALTPQALDLIRAVQPIESEPYIFTMRWKGKVRLVTSGTIRRWFAVVCAHTGIDSCAVEGEKVVPHVLRHSAASHLEAQGAHPTEIQEFLDHESIATTERYLHRRPAMRAIRMRDLMTGKKEGAA
jgi:integrase/recombinase XerC